MSNRYKRENDKGRQLRLSIKRKRNKGENLAVWRKKFAEMISPDESKPSSVDINIVEYQQNTSEIVNENLESECDPKNTPKSVVSGTCKPEVLGRRIVDIKYFISKFQQLNNHGPFGCGLSEMEIISERRRGFVSDIKMKCAMCNYTKVVCTENSESTEMNSNAAAVAGIMKIGCGFSNIEEFLSTLNIPPMSVNTFMEEQKHISEAWETTAMKEMEAAANEEKMLAIQRGDVDAEGVPLVTLVW